MKFTLAQISAAAARGGMDGDEVMHDLLTLAEKNGNTPTLREYFIASAPEHPQPWFKPVMPPRPDDASYDGWNLEKDRQRFIQWPSAWADEQLRLLAARLIG